MDIRRLLLVGVAVWLAGCTQSTQPATTSSPTRAAPAAAPVPAVAPASLVVRTADYAQDTATIEAAAATLAARCMRERGFEIEVHEPEFDRTNGLITPDLEYRSSSGFGLALAARTQDPLPERLQDDRFSAAYFGSDDGAVPLGSFAIASPIGDLTAVTKGCLGSSFRRLGGGSTRRFLEGTALADSMLGAAVEDTAEAPKWIAVNSAWIACMEARGYALSGPQEALSSSAAAADGARANDAVLEAERALAVADGECQIEVGMPDVLRVIRERWLEQATPQDRAFLRTAASARTLVLRRASALG